MSVGDLGLENWQDVDIVQFRLGIAIGVFPPSAAFPTEIKPILWTNHPIGNMLYGMLETMVVGWSASAARWAGLSVSMEPRIQIAISSQAQTS